MLAALDLKLQREPAREITLAIGSRELHRIVPRGDSVATEQKPASVLLGAHLHRDSQLPGPESKTAFPPSNKPSFFTLQRLLPTFNAARLIVFVLYFLGAEFASYETVRFA